MPVSRFRARERPTPMAETKWKMQGELNQCPHFLGRSNQILPKEGLGIHSAQQHNLNVYEKKLTLDAFGKVHHYQAFVANDRYQKRLS